MNGLPKAVDRAWEFEIDLAYKQGRKVPRSPSLFSHGTRKTITRNHVAAINEATGAPMAWNPNVNGPVRAIKVIGNRIYLVGDEHGAPSPFKLEDTALTLDEPCGVDPEPAWGVSTGQKRYAITRRGAPDDPIYDRRAKPCNHGIGNLVNPSGLSNPSARLITDWIDVGLIDRPTKRGLGRGRGTIATWPDTQLQLFLLVLEKRDAGAKRVATLCNIPVGIWLYWGDTYAPLRQVRRALSTWSKANTGGRWASERAAKDAARELVDQLADQSATDEDREHVINTIGALGYRVATGHPINREPLVTALNRILPPSDAKTPPLGEMYADLLHARITAMSRLDEATDELYQFARAQLRIGNHEYAAIQPRLAANPSLARIANRRDATEQLNNACLDLVTLLGLFAVAADKASPNPHPP